MLSLLICSKLDDNLQRLAVFLRFMAQLLFSRVSINVLRLFTDVDVVIAVGNDDDDDDASMTTMLSLLLDVVVVVDCENNDDIDDDEDEFE